MFSFFCFWSFFIFFIFIFFCFFLFFFHNIHNIRCPSDRRRKTTKDGERRRKTAKDDDERRRKTTKDDDGRRRRKTAKDDDERRRKTTEDGERRRRKIRPTVGYRPTYSLFFVISSIFLSFVFVYRGLMKIGFINFFYVFRCLSSSFVVFRRLSPSFAVFWVFARTRQNPRSDASSIALRCVYVADTNYHSN